MIRNDFAFYLNDVNSELLQNTIRENTEIRRAFIWLWFFSEPEILCMYLITYCTYAQTVHAYFWSLHSFRGKILYFYRILDPDVESAESVQTVYEQTCKKPISLQVLT